MMIWNGQDNATEGEGSKPREDPGRAREERPGSDLPPGSIGQRVEAVIEAAERAAAEIRRDAEEWAQRHMEESRRRADQMAAERVQELSTITDGLVSRARAVAKQSDELIDALDAAGRRALRTESESTRKDTLVQSGPVGSPPQRDGGVSEGARLLAAEMAAAGSSRETIAGRLREEFGIQDPTAILNDAGL
jgi:hypothetical protein